MDKAKSLDLELVSYDCEASVVGGCNLASSQNKVREHTISYIKSAIVTAREFTAPLVVIAGGRFLYGFGKEKAWEWMRSGLVECTKFAEDEGIYLGLEHLPPTEGNMVITLSDMVRILSEVDSPRLVATLDTGHVNVNQESLSDYVFTLGDRLKHVHLDDNDGKSDEHRPPGWGTLNFVPLFMALDKINYEGALSIEVSLGFCTDPDAVASEGRVFFNSMCKRLGKNGWQ